jgi:hypothetical protein
MIETSHKESILRFLEEIGFLGKEDNINKVKEFLTRSYSKIDIDETIKYEKIKKISYIGKKRTFDLSVSILPNLQNFVAQGFIVHNSGKDFMVGIITAYEAMKLLECKGGDPYAKYNLSRSNPITILTVACASRQAELAFNEIKARVIGSKYFRDKIGEEGIGTQKIHLLTLKDKKENLDSTLNSKNKGSIVIEVGHSNSDSLLGKQLYVLILDEVASYKQSSGSSSGERIYTALTPSFQTFFHYEEMKNNDGTLVLDENNEPEKQRVIDAKLIAISSPRGEDGLFYRLYKESHLHDNRLMCKLPTWRVNTRITEKSLRETNASMTDEDFIMEYGAEFSPTAGESMFVRGKVMECFLPHVKMSSYGVVGNIYFAHLDPATTSHNYALVILHRETYFNKEEKKADFRIVVDVVKHWHPQGGKPIRIDEVDEYVIGLKRKFYLGLVTYDVWNSIQSIEKLQKHGIPAKCTHFSPKYKMAIYHQLEILINSGRLWIPRHDLLKDELLFLQRKVTPKGFRIFPPREGEVRTDDIVDALAGACYSAMNSTSQKLPFGRTVDTGSGSANNTVWRSMQGVPYGVGSGESVSRSMENRIQNNRGDIPPSIFRG